MTTFKTILDSTASTMEPTPETIQEIEVTIYVLLFSAGMLIWDMVYNLGDDYRMLKREFKKPILVYFSSRISALGLLVTGLAMGPARADIDCEIAGRVLETFFFLVINTTTGLFALRVRAVYADHRLVKAAFLALWLATTGSCFLTFFVLDSTYNPRKDVSSCILVERKIALGILIAVAAMVHDTAVFLGISYQLYRCFRDNTRSRIRQRFIWSPVSYFVLGTDDLPPLARSLLQEGQIYYLISLFWETVVVILLLVPSIGTYYRCFMLPAHLVIVNSVACLVFRNVRLGRFREDTISYRNRSTLFSSMASSDVESSGSMVFAENVNMNSIGTERSIRSQSEPQVVDKIQGCTRGLEDALVPECKDSQKLSAR